MLPTRHEERASFVADLWQDLPDLAWIGVRGFLATGITCYAAAHAGLTLRDMELGVAFIVMVWGLMIALSSLAHLFTSFLDRDA